MIRTAIIGAGTPDGGELIRILAMHPEVELEYIQGEGLEGIKVSDHHHGLIGETSLSFTDTIDFENCDVLFVCSPKTGKFALTQIRETNPELKIILFHVPEGFGENKKEIVYGVPEINRKALVRHALTAEVPESFATMALIALFPFAMNLLLNNDIRISVTAPRSIIEEYNRDIVTGEIRTLLAEVQKSFNSEIDIQAEIGDTRRSAIMQIEFDCSLNLQQMIELYEMYDDHNFTFVTTSPIGVSEVAGTDKCIISLSRSPEGKATLTVAADCRLRGASGDAVHIMNLMFGLHEKTGLALKASDFEPIG